MANREIHAKYITNSIKVDLDKSREVWSNGEAGDRRVSLWADENNEHVWLETNGDPVTEGASIVEYLESHGVSSAVADQVIEGDLSGLAKPPTIITDAHGQQWDMTCPHSPEPLV